MKKLLYMFILALVLTGCGKADTKKEQHVTNKEEQKASETEQTDNQEDSAGDVDDTDSSEAKDEDSQSTDETPVVQEPSNDAKHNTSSNNNTSTKPSMGSTNSGNTSNSGNTNNSGSNNTMQTPSNNTGSNNSTNTGSSTTETKKPVKRVSEEVKSAEVAYKYGITKYDVTTNYYTLYSDGSKELLDSDSYTVYDSSNYSATDSQLKSEADSNASKYMSYYQEVLRLVNEIRAEAGVAPLALDTTLCEAASMRALEMDYGNEMSHTRPSGKDCFSVLDFYGISFGTCGENIAAGQTSATSVVNGWKNSPGHYQNMINASFTKLGVGYSATGVGDYGYYWCQLFTN